MIVICKFVLQSTAISPFVLKSLEFCVLSYQVHILLDNLVYSAELPFVTFDRYEVVKGR